MKRWVNRNERNSFTFNTIIVFILELLLQYPSSIVTLSFIYKVTSNNFIVEQMKSFLHHKKDPEHYFVSELIDLIHYFDYDDFHLHF